MEAISKIEEKIDDDLAVQSGQPALRQRSMHCSSPSFL
jgi:hypothetical protein